jgi:hypothetical protein
MRENSGHVLTGPSEVAVLPGKSLAEVAAPVLWHFAEKSNV